MTLAQLVPIVLPASLALVVFTLGLETSPGDLTYLFGRPALLWRSVLSMNVLTPLLAVGIAAIARLAPETELAILLLAVSPVPPVLPKKQAKAGGNASYAIGLLALSAVISIVAIPTTVAAVGRAFGVDFHVPAALIVRVVVSSVFAPLLLGVLVNRVAGGFAARIAKPLSTIGTVSVGVLAILVLAGSWKTLTGTLGGFTAVAVAVFVLASLGVGHFLGGPDEDDRTVLALSTASRHPGVATAIAGAVASDNPAVSATVMFAFLLGLVLTGPYAKWRTRPVNGGR
jgi:BASS family bile acid:Na+ symporter